MDSRYRVFAVGGERSRLIELASALEGHGATLGAVADPARTMDALAQFQPHLALVVAGQAPETAMQRVAWLRADPRWSRLPIVLVSNTLPQSSTGVDGVVPEPSNIEDFAAWIVGQRATSTSQHTQEVALEELDLLEPVEELGDGEPADGDLELLEGASVVEELPPLSTRLLLVDDDPALVRLFSLLLRKSGFDVRTAADGLEGLERALETRPELVIADLNMPRLDGWGLLRAIRADHRLSETPVIFLSSHDDYRDNLRALSSGAQDYVAKGGRLDALVARIRALLAPRVALHDALGNGEGHRALVEEVGAQWALRQAVSSGASGLLLLRDPFWNIAVGLIEGEPCFARAQIGGHVLEGPAALPPLIALRGGELLFDPAASPPERNFHGDLEQLLEQAALHNNQSESIALDRLLVQASRIEVEPRLYELYEQLGPPAARPIAAMVRQGHTPREIIALADASPTEVEETLRDLVRRRVLKLEYDRA